MPLSTGVCLAAGTIFPLNRDGCICYPKEFKTKKKMHPLFFLLLLIFKHRLESSESCRIPPTGIISNA